MAFALVILFAARSSAAADPPIATLPPPATPDPARLAPRRYELAGFPIVGGNSDIGVQFGGAATYTRFYDGVAPYVWNIDLLLSASVKDDTGVRLVQQSHVLRFDAPDLLDGRMRFDGRASFARTINAGYYGVGDASVAGPQAPGSLGTTYEYTQLEGRERNIVRIHTGSHFDFAIGSNLRLEAPDVYALSQLQHDLVGTQLPGGQTALLGTLSTGFFLDTRDSEFITRSGFLYQVGVAGTVGTAEQVGYGEVAAVLTHYAPLGGPFIFASRVVASFQFGRVPFYDLMQGGVFEPQGLFGGETGVRGVPNGRYAGRIKMVSNTELRATPFPRFKVIGQRMRIGTSVFFDAGRVWSDYQVISAADGTSLDLKYGIGGGVFLQWGEAAIFRIEAAYSPDAVAENPGLPIGFYVSDGLMF